MPARGDKDDVVLVIHIIVVTMYSLQNYTPTFPIYVIHYKIILLLFQYMSLSNYCNLNKLMIYDLKSTQILHKLNYCKYITIVIYKYTMM